MSNLGVHWVVMLVLGIVLSFAIAPAIPRERP
jgi:hypothetical protein